MSPDTLVKKFHESCRVIIAHAKDPYAIQYARAGLKLTTRDEITTQALYILNNLRTWRGDIARETKEELRSYH